MGISASTALAIIGAHRHQPIRGDVLLFGRQSVLMTPEQVVDLLRENGVEPAIRIEDCELDRETRIGGEQQVRRDGNAISDRSFFRMLGVESLTILDHSDYEGAELIVDLNKPVPSELASKFDFIIDGGTLDNIFNPPQAMFNSAFMLRPNGRLLTYNLYSHLYTPYTILPQQWYLDFFAINRFAFAQVYFGVYEFCGERSYYQVNLKKRATTRYVYGNFPWADPNVTIGTVVYAVKAADSTWEKQPSQEIYRSDAEWQQMSEVFSNFASYEIPRPILNSSDPLPMIMPGGDDFEYIGVDGYLATENDRARYDAQIRGKILNALRLMDSQFGLARWGILETEKIFFDLIAESNEARAIIAKENITLFDTRMLNGSVTVNGISKTVYPAAAALMIDLPILVLSTEVPIDTMWKSVSRYLRHTKFYAACHCKDRLVSYFDAGAQLSVSLEHGEYKGNPSHYAEEIKSLLAAHHPNLEATIEKRPSLLKIFRR